MKAYMMCLDIRDRGMSDHLWSQTRLVRGDDCRSEADACDLINESPVRFMVIEKTRKYSTRLLVQFMVRHYR